MSTVTPMRRTAITLRIDQAQKDLIDTAAALRGLSRTDFLLDTACREAETVLLDQRLFRLDARTFRRFQKMLDAPTAAPQGLRDLLNRKPPWR